MEVDEVDAVDGVGAVDGDGVDWKSMKMIE